MRQADPQCVLAFLAVVDEQSFRGAARALGVPKSTLSARVAALEAHLGVQLLHRTTRRVRLTDIGASYQREVAPAIEILRSAEGVVGRLRAHPSGRLRLSAPFELGQTVLGYLIPRYASLYPEVEIDIDLTDRMVDLVEESFDLAIRIGPLRDSNLIGRRLGAPTRLGVYASPDYLRRAGTPSTLRDLAHHRCLVMTGAQSPTAWSFARAGKARSWTVVPSISVNSYQVLATLTMEGVGVARLPEIYANCGVSEGKLREILVDFAPPPAAVHAVYPSSRHVAPAVRAMLDVASECFTEQPWCVTRRARPVAQRRPRIDRN